MESSGSEAVIGLKMAGTVELMSGGLAHVLNAAQVHIDEVGNVRVHVDRFELKPIGG
jgi:hypothetical protein